MVVLCAKFVLCVVLAFDIIIGCDSQFTAQRISLPTSPLPFPTCRADDIECLRRSIRTFFFLMNSNQFGMSTIDPMIVNSVGLTLPEDQMTILLRKVNVTGASWTKLQDRSFSLEYGTSGLLFISDLHVTGLIIMDSPSRLEPVTAFITMDIQAVETNVTYPWNIQLGIDNEDYIDVGPERIAVRNMRTPFYFLHPKTGSSSILDTTLHKKPSILEHISNEITAAVMHTVVDNLRIFASYVPIRYYYKYYDNDSV